MPVPAGRQDDGDLMRDFGSTRKPMCSSDNTKQLMEGPSNATAGASCMARER